MLSGSLLLNKDYKLSTFLKKRFLRIIPPLIFWSLVYIVYDNIIVGQKVFEPIEFISLIFQKLMKGSKYHLWFIYTLLGLYLFIPILRKWVKNSNNKEILYFLGIWLITVIYNFPFAKLHLPKIPIPLTNFTGFIGYMVLGYYLSKITLKNKYIPIILIIIGQTITVYGTFYLTQDKNSFSSLFYGSNTPNVLLTSIGFFLLFKDFKTTNLIVKKTILFFSNQSFGIYLAHVFIMSLLYKNGINWKIIFWQPTNPMISIPITVICSFLLSSLTIYLLRKIKYARSFTG